MKENVLFPFERECCCIMHQSFVSMAPKPVGRAGDSGANVPCFYFCIVPAVRWGGGGEMREICNT